MRSAEISVTAIAHNVRRVRQITNSQVIAVVKANAYGHGLQIAARAALAGGAAMLGVADIAEALALRQAGIAADVASILCWLHAADQDFTEAVQQRIELGVSGAWQLEKIADAVRRVRGSASAEVVARARVQLKINTGLSRNGADERELREFFELAARLERAGILTVTGIFSHLANAGERADNEQAARFDSAIELAAAAGLNPKMQHLAASAASLGGNSALRYNTVRVGLAVYGLSPFASCSSQDLGLRPALRLKAQIVALRRVPAGTGVSYGHNYVAPRDTVLGLVPVGYADGMPRALNNANAEVLIAGARRPIVGRIGMDQCIIDLGLELGERVHLGDEVVLFGDPARGEPAVEEWAKCLETINYEIIVGLGARISRVRVAADL
ncbi:alanine racemase [Canibacter sp. lx-45]|uniref:alanine racemase n=1 Tax=Canibacter zhuwentaonis TaxID=2837491 RepID=UPI001BDC8AD0|nr:alanine racemase [Canibacter zhuwentaonis]MBT1035189.1 alanine racemase [Canibacter zhuwentaonis]